MSKLLIYFFMAIGLSMDAFTLALAYGTTSLDLKKRLLLSNIVGIFHFLMPKLGGIIGSQFLTGFITKANYIVGIVFIILALQMFFSRNEEEKGSITSLFSMIIFAITVSIDSFSVGLVLSLTTKSLTIPGLIFSITSFIFTFLGVTLGNKLSEKYGARATYIGMIILFVLGLKYIF